MQSAAERAACVGLHYVDKRAKALSDDKLRVRLQKLAVPPARQDVKFARDPKSHILAAGRYEAGRLQCRYHDKWTQTGHDVKRERLALLSRAGLQVGYPESSREDGGRGAATLRRKDIALPDGKVRLRFFGKGDKRIQRIVDDPALARALGLLKAQPGEMLFRWKEKDGEDYCLSAEGVNAALRQHSSKTTSAKDFRMFRASSIVAAALQDMAKTDKKAHTALLKHSIKESARFLANTPTVCKASYVHPDIQDAFGDEAFDPAALFTGPQKAGLSCGETALLHLLQQKAAN